MAEHHNVRVARLILLGRERPAENRLHSEGGKKSGCCRATSYLLGFVAFGQGKSAVGVDGHSVEDMVLIFPIKIVCRGDRKPRHSGKAGGRRNTPDATQRVRVLERQRT